MKSIGYVLTLAVKAKVPLWITTSDSSNDVNVSAYHNATSASLDKTAFAFKYRLEARKGNLHS